MPGTVEKVMSAMHRMLNKLGRDGFISTTDIMEKMSELYTPGQEVHLVDVMPNTDKLVWCKENKFVLYPGPPVECTLLDLCHRYVDEFDAKNVEAFESLEFARYEKVQGSRWFMMRTTPVPHSVGKDYEWQAKLLSLVERVPSVVELAWFMIVYRRTRGWFTFPGHFVRTKTTYLPVEGKVLIGNYGEEGLRVDVSTSYFEKSPKIGLASMRRY